MEDHSSELIATFNEYLLSERRYSDKTATAYCFELNRLQKFLFAEFECGLLGAQKSFIKRFVIWLSKNGQEPRSINRSLSAFRTFYKWCIREGHIITSPISGVRSLKMSKRLVGSVPLEDIRSLFENEFYIKSDSKHSSFEKKRDALMLLLLYSLGLRRAELIELRVTDFDWSRRTVRIFGKRGKQRQVPLPAALEIHFKEYLHLRKQLPDQEADYLMLTTKGKKLYAGLVYKRILHYLNSTTKVVDKSPHVLRHSFATHLLNSGVEINSVKELLGHESLSSTQVYTDSSFEELVRVYNHSHPKGTKNNQL